VNARLDPESQRQLEFLLETTGVGISDVLKASIAHYHAAVRSGHAPRLRHLTAAIGRHGSGRSDISARTHELLSEALDRKRVGPQARRVNDAP
jgi:hypothetical protein